MGGRGRGGISKIPASLQAKMDAVSLVLFVGRFQLMSRSHRDHRMQASRRPAPSRLGDPIHTPHPWRHFYGLRLFDSNLAEEDQVCQVEELVPELDLKEHQDKVDLSFPAQLLAHSVVWQRGERGTDQISDLWVEVHPPCLDLLDVGDLLVD
jgi:hypothetical protein